MHIAYYSSALPDTGAPNGVVTYVRIMRDALRLLGHRVTVVTPTDIERADGTVAKLPVLRGIRRLFTSVEGAALDAARGDGAQIFEIEESFGVAGTLVGRGVPVVMRLHGPHALLRQYCETADQKHQGDKRQAAELSALGKVDAVLSPTQRLLEELFNKFCVNPTFARVIPNPVPKNSKTWDIKSADLDQLLFVGRVDYLKGADVAVRAVEQARKARPSIKLTMIGPGDPIAGATCLGTQTPAQIETLRLQSALALATSRFETFSYAIAEAMALGMPVLASETIGARALIEDGVSGRVSNSLANAIVELLSNPEELVKLGAAARESVGRKLDPAAVAKETLEFYREICMRG